MDATPLDLLLVEDSVDDRAFVSHLIQQMGRRVNVARNGAEALEMMFGSAEPAWDAAARLAPKFITLDFHMPKVGGLELVRMFKGNPQTRAIPVIVLSASEDRRDAAECYRAGVNSYIVKPTDFADFARVVTLLGQYWMTLNLAPERVNA
jgi:CheY-like chemotaxis protein